MLSFWGTIIFLLFVFIFKINIDKIIILAFYHNEKIGYVCLFLLLSLFILPLCSCFKKHNDSGSVIDCIVMDLYYNLCTPYKGLDIRPLTRAIYYRDKSDIKQYSALIMWRILEMVVWWRFVISIINISSESGILSSSIFVTLSNSEKIKFSFILLLVYIVIIVLCKRIHEKILLNSVNGYFDNSFVFMGWDKFFSDIRILLLILSLVYIIYCILKNLYPKDIVYKLQSANNSDVLGLILLLSFPILYSISFLITFIYSKIKHFSIFVYILNYGIDWNRDNLKILKLLRLPSFSHTWSLEKKFYNHDTLNTKLSVFAVITLSYIVFILIALVIMVGCINIYILISTYLIH